MHRVEKEIGHPNFFMKRDDLLGRGFGGNKLRKLEYIFAKALKEGATSLITIGGFESNNVALLSMIARMYNLKPIVILMGPCGGVPQNVNMAILKRLNVETHIIEYSPEDASSKATVRKRVDLKVYDLINELKASGEQPFYVPEGGCCLEGTYAFYEAFNELHSQMQAIGIPKYDIYLPVGSGSSFAGLWCGIKKANVDVNLTGISISSKKFRCRKEIIKAAERVCGIISLDIPMMDELDVYDEFIGDGYGIATELSRKGVDLAFNLEGLLLDQTYTGKTFGAMLDIFKTNAVQITRPIVFWHTGGMPGAIDSLIDSKFDTGAQSILTNI